MPELIGGFQRAVGDVNTLKTSNYTNALGAIGFGARGEHYRVLYLNEATSLTMPAGNFVFLETATAAVHSTNNASATLFQPFICQSASDAAFWAGILQSSCRGQGLCIVQVGGPATVSFTGANTANVSAVTAGFVPAGVNHMVSTAVATGLFPVIGAIGRMNPGYSSAQSTAVINIIPADIFKFA